VDGGMLVSGSWAALAPVPSCAGAATIPSLKPASRNLEAQVEQFLSLPAHEDVPARHWWQWWRRAD